MVRRMVRAEPIRDDVAFGVALQAVFGLQPLDLSLGQPLPKPPPELLINGTREVTLPLKFELPR